MVDVFGYLGYVDPLSGNWKADLFKALLFNVVLSPLNVGRLIQIKGWPPFIHPRTYFNASFPLVTSEDYQQMVRSSLNATLAVFLLIATETSFLGYSFFWAWSDFIPFGTDYTTPPEFYPVFSCPLGAPLGPPVALDTLGYIYERRFASGTVVHVELNNRAATGVRWSGACPLPSPSNSVTPSQTPSQTPSFGSSPSRAASAIINNDLEEAGSAGAGGLTSAALAASITVPLLVCALAMGALLWIQFQRRDRRKRLILKGGGSWKGKAAITTINPVSKAISSSPPSAAL